jgi:hypothetical protein
VLACERSRQEDPASRDVIKTTSWANKQAKKAFNQRRRNPRDE